MAAQHTLLPRLASFAPSLVVALLSLSPGCRHQSASSVVLMISAEPELGAQISSLTVQTNHGGQENFVNVPIDPDSNRLPGTLVIFDNASDDVDPSIETEITLDATADDGTGSGLISIKRKVIIDRLEQDQKVLRVALRYACSNFNHESCALTRTCVAGTCQDARYRSADLPPYEFKNVFPTKEEGDPCFDEEDETDNGCFKGAQELEASALTLRDGKCFLEVPAGPEPEGQRQLNLAVLWKAAPKRYITLDNEPREKLTEGWAFAEASGYVLQLPLGYCDLAAPAGDDPKKPQLLFLRYSHACSPKPTNLSSCQPPGRAQGQEIAMPKKPASPQDAGADGG